MSDLYFEDFAEGFEAFLHKQANEHLFSSPNNASLFPTSSSQAKWKYAKSTNFLRLHDGQKVYSFSFPKGHSRDEEFEAHREPDHEHTKFEEGATEKGLAQVHRSDPGSIYFTLQEGKDNPTYTFKHLGESTWRGVPKKRKAKEVVLPGVDASAVAEGVKAATIGYNEDEPKESRSVKKADFSPFKWAAGSGAHALQRGVMSPGEGVFNIGGGNSVPMGMAGMAALGGAGGLAYHLGKKHLYNTQEENEQEKEQGNKHLLRRMLIPAAGLSLLGGAQASLFDTHYRDLAAGAGQASGLPQ